MREKLEFLKDVARQAGHIMMDFWEEEVAVFQKPDRTIVTSVDLEISQMVCRRILDSYPESALLTEETSGKLLYPKRTGFIVDELDGTYSYSIKRPGFTFQCAYYEDFDQLNIGLIFDPLHDLMVYSLRGQGVWLERRGEVEKLPGVNEKPWLQLRFGHHRTYMTQTHRKMYSLMGVRSENIIPTGSIGSKSIDFALGQIDAIVALNRAVSPWDWAPGKAILEELGYRFIHITGEDVQLRYPGNFRGFGYLVCPPGHLEKFRRELDWIVRKVSRRSNRK
ncbi:MAG: inositol monophosphatase family protein [Bacteroidia bacterium]|nr:inositol monophosphatase family protein [Bacteroidia bacterium]